MPNRPFFDKIDAPLSALAFNCCQFSCFFPSQQGYCEYHSTSDTANWMQTLVQANPDIKMRDVALPGTHDSASYTIAPFKPFSAAGRTQNLNVEQQLMAGARYLDVRVATSAKSPTVLSIWHGCLEGGKLDVVFQQIDDFLASYPGEFLVLELVPEYGRNFGGPQKRACLDQAKAVLGDKLAPGKDLRDALANKTLKELVDAKHQVAVLLHDRFFSDDLGLSVEEVGDQYGFVKSNRFLNSPWHNTRDMSDLLEKNLNKVKEHGKDHRYWLSNQFVATPGVKGPPELVGALMGSNPLRPVSWACRLYKSGVLDNYLRQNADEPWNIVTLDYIDLCPEIVDFVISLNWPTQLKIHLAATYVGDHSTDITEKIQSFICRDRVLFLTDDIEDGVTLTVAYSFGDSYYVMTVDCHCDCPLVLSQYCCSKEADMVEIESGTTGVVYKGDIYANKEEVVGKSGTIEFSHDGSNCEFTLL